MTLARLVPSSPGAAPQSSARAWRWTCSKLGCFNITRDTFTPGCLNQQGQPIPGGGQLCWDRLTRGRDRVAWTGAKTWVDPG